MPDESLSPGAKRAIVTGVATVLGLGAVGAFYGAARTYVDGAAASSQSVLTFAGLGAALLFFAWGVYNTEVSESGARDVPEDFPWRVREEWQSPELVDEAPVAWDPAGFVASVLSPGTVLVAVPLFGFLVHDQIVAPAMPNWALFSVLGPLLLLDGAALWQAVVRPRLHRRRFGSSTLRLETMPVRLGERLEARLQTGIPQEDAPDDGVRVVFTCYDQYTEVVDLPARQGQKEHLEKDRLWQTDASVPAEYGTDGLAASISLAIPPDQPPSTPRKTRERVFWEVTATADLSGVDYEASFEIPVFPPRWRGLRAFHVKQPWACLGVHADSDPCFT